MLIDSLQRHLAICAQNDLPKIAKADSGFWNVISIREPERQKIQSHGFKRIHTVICYDIIGVAGVEESQSGAPREEQLEAIFQFIDTIPQEPILVHCWAGVPRSTAVALVIMIREMHRDGFTRIEIIEQAPEILLQIRPKAAPNPLMLELGLAQFLPPKEARKLKEELLNHPGLHRNRVEASQW